jgi:hypothetical protein
MQADWTSRKRDSEDVWQTGASSRGRSPSGHSNPRHPASEMDRGPRKRGRGKGSSYIGDVSYVPTTEHRIQVDMSAFPPDSNVIMQLLGPRGRHQQRMKNESDSIVTTTGKGSRGPLMPGEEPLSLVIRSKDPAIPLTQRQIAVVHQIYDDIIRHVQEYALVCHVRIDMLSVRDSIVRRFFVLRYQCEECDLPTSRTGFAVLHSSHFSLPFIGSGTVTMQQTVR